MFRTLVLLILWWAFHGILAILVTKALRRASAEHWTVKARLLWPLRMLTQARLLEATAFAVIAAGRNPLVNPLSYAVGYLIFLAGARVIREMVRTSLPLRRMSYRAVVHDWNHWDNPLLSATSMLAFLAGLLWNQPLNSAAFSFFFFAAGWQIFQAFGGWLVMHRLMGQFRPVATDIMARLTTLVPDRVTVLEWKAGICQALALVWSRTVLFTIPLLSILSPKEIDAVFLHEIGHLREPVIVKMMRLATGTAFAGVVLILPLCHDYSATGAVVGIYAWLGLNIHAASVIRRLERNSDATAIEHDSAAYASALERIHEYDLIPAVMPGRLGKTHPDLWDRLRAAGVEPAWERPAPPGSWGWLLIVLAGIAILIARYWPLA